MDLHKISHLSTLLMTLFCQVSSNWDSWQCVCVSKDENKANQNSGASTSMKFLGVQNMGVQNILLRWRIRCCTCLVLPPRKRSQGLWVLFGFWIQYIPHSSVLYRPHGGVCNRRRLFIGCSTIYAVGSSWPMVLKISMKMLLRSFLFSFGRLP